ncbi:hypothetical protein [Kitasatospora sp. MAA4]|uniref:hypothetical protein n=1 Tax=Kitasatospora sp. MAA4 TaxID=3035093 RepID=UPI0024737FD5|nr:hypothetical protein [Kitasatospora sp. MAA4]
MIDTPERRLADDYQEHRVRALVRLAANPAAEHATLREVLAEFHTAELAWIAHGPQAPGWYRNAANEALPPESDDGVLRILTDDEPDTRPDPASLLQRWLAAAAGHIGFDSHRLYDAVLRSHHLTQDLLRDVPARQALPHSDPEVRAQLIIQLCGADPESLCLSPEVTGQ